MNSAVQREKKEVWSLGTTILAGPLVWSAYFVVSYLLVEAACHGSFWLSRVGGLTVLAAVILGMTLIALLPIVVAGRRAYRDWQGAKPGGARATEEWGGFQALASLLLTGLFALATLLTGLPALFVHPCRWL